MKKEYETYVSKQFEVLNEMENSTYIDIDKVHLLLDEWLEEQTEFCIADFDNFFWNVQQIIKAEIEIRISTPEYKKIWLTKSFVN